jgi:hypothetical protein
MGDWTERREDGWGFGGELMLDVDVDGIVADTQTRRHADRRQTPHLPAGSVWFLRQSSLAQAVVLYTGDRTGQSHVSRLEYSSLTRR